MEKLTTFSGDQGYDFLQARHMITNRKLTLLGPKIGPYNKIGNLYLGPAYYYLIAPSLYVFDYDPIGPAVLTVTLSLVTILLIYITASKFISRPAGIIASSIYAFSTFLINQSSAPSNPHLMPFFASILLLSQLKIIKSKSLIWPIVGGLSLGIMFQLHYLAAALFASSLAFLIFSKQIRKIIYLIVGILIAISPQILFELRHEFFVTNIFLRQLKYGNNVSSISTFLENFRQSISQVSFIFSPTEKVPAVIFIFFILLTFAAVIRNQISKNVFIMLLLNILLGIIFASLYSGSIGPHYFVSIYPSVCILAGATIASIFYVSRSLLIRSMPIVVSSAFLAVNLLSLDLNSPQGYTMPKGLNLTAIKKVSAIIVQDADSGKKFNVASTLDGDTRSMPYRYLVEVYGKIPQAVEHYPDSDFIYLITRDEEAAVKRYTVWEVASFAPFEFAYKWEIQNGIHLYKLTKPTTSSL